ncbi:hypothetical protein HHK36_005860 [Tetracentron sinense]|uniref:Vesicle transport protein n=1 Tax=Tetracentron sinense TaxID=13715 RepID=A0A834ZM61_TETSI|nr:hypothetical protein HHK36_005860 [Tetracentron sinense]
MQATAQTWFTGGPSSNDQQQSSSLLADWNSYAASKDSEEIGSSTLGFDLEAAVRTANDKVTGTFSVTGNLKPALAELDPLRVDQIGAECAEIKYKILILFLVSQGVRDLPGNLQSATSSVPSGKSLVYFGFLMATGVFFVFIAFTMFLPVMVLMPQKFAICFTLGCAFIIGSFFALKGPKNQFAHMSSKERLPFTLGFIGSMVGTIYVSMVLHSYLLSVLFSVLQVLALSYYALSYFPGGSAGMKFLSSTLTSSILKCFGR